MASYNWGEQRVINLLRRLPANPRERNFWKLLEQVSRAHAGRDLQLRVLHRVGGGDRREPPAVRLSVRQSAGVSRPADRHRTRWTRRAGSRRMFPGRACRHRGAGALLRVVFFVGLVSGDPQDDGVYYGNALALARDGPRYLERLRHLPRDVPANPIDQFHVRPLTTYPIAAAFVLFGAGEVQATLWALACLDPHRAGGVSPGGSGRRSGGWAAGGVPVRHLPARGDQRHADSVRRAARILLRGGVVPAHGVGVAQAAVAMAGARRGGRRRRLPRQCAGTHDSRGRAGRRPAASGAAREAVARRRMLSGRVRSGVRRRSDGLRAHHRRSITQLPYPRRGRDLQVSPRARVERRPRLAPRPLHQRPAFRAPRPGVTDPFLAHRPAGLVVYLFAAAVLFSLVQGRNRLLLAFAAGLFVYLELGPVRITVDWAGPELHYMMVFKQERFLLMLTAPLVAIMAACLVHAVAMRSRVVAAVILAAVFVTSLDAASRTRTYYRSWLSDLRTATGFRDRASRTDGVRGLLGGASTCRSSAAIGRRTFACSARDDARRPGGRVPDGRRQPWRRADGRLRRIDAAELRPPGHAESPRRRRPGGRKPCTCQGRSAGFAWGFGSTAGRKAVPGPRTVTCSRVEHYGA